MTPEPLWLSLKTASRDVADQSAKHEHLSVPKKIVRLATARNRVKRVLREALRATKTLRSSGKNYYFRISRAPSPETLRHAGETLRELLLKESKD